MLFLRHFWTVMPSAVNRILLPALVAGLLGFLPLTPAAPGLAEAAVHDDDRDQTGKSKRAHSSKIGIAPTTMGLATIQNFRTAVAPDSTRLVLDLDRKTRIRKHIPAQADGVVAEIPRATLSKSVQHKIASGKLGHAFVIRQTAADSVAVSLPSGSYQTYKLFSLTNPPRLVIDVTPSTQPESMMPVSPAEPGPMPVAPPQPMPPKAKSFTTIVIDPGHGGKDPGAHGRRGTMEKDITLKVGLKLRDLFKKDPNIRVLMTRERDVFVELEDRAKFANGIEADLFVSIHVNSHPSRAVKGIEIYHFGEAKDQRALEVAARENGTPLNSTGTGVEYFLADLLTTKKIEESMELAWTTKESLVTHMNGHYTVTDHGVKTAPFYVLRYTSMPSILAEIAYISNPSEEELLRKNVFIRDVADSLLNGVKSFLATGKPTAR